MSPEARRPVGAQARKANTEVPLPTMSERLTALRDDVRRERIASSQRTATPVFHR
jgi:hypothetical protein